MRRGDLVPSPRALFHLLYNVSEVISFRDLENVRSFSMSNSSLRNLNSESFTLAVIPSLGEPTFSVDISRTIYPAQVYSRCTTLLTTSLEFR